MFKKCMSCYKYPDCTHEDIKGKYMFPQQSAADRNICIYKKHPELVYYIIAGGILLVIIIIMIVRSRSRNEIVELSK